MTLAMKEHLTGIRAAIDNARMMADIAAMISADVIGNRLDDVYYRVTIQEAERIVFATSDVFSRIDAVLGMIERLADA